MSGPGSDAAAIRQIVRGLIEAGHSLRYVDDGGEDVVPTVTEQEVVDAVTAVDVAKLHVALAGGAGYAMVLFVLGNGDPVDLVADWNVSLTPVIDPIMATW